MTSNFLNSMYLRSFLCEEANIKQHTPSKKELCEIAEEYGNPDSHAFFLFKDFTAEWLYVWSKIFQKIWYVEIHVFYCKSKWMILICFRENFFFQILVSEYSEYSKTSRYVIFSWRPDVCVYVSDFQRLKPR